jgi:glyoxylase-like metal-dependent hydrolase (beta-lactamase superfamily II)
MIPGSGFDGNVYLLKDGDNIVLIDTGTGLYVTGIYKFVESLGLKKESINKVILTHVHIDHSGGLPRIVKDVSPIVHVYESEAQYIETGEGEVILSSMMGVSFPPTKVDVRLKNGDIIKISDGEYRVMNTPGHTAGSICLYDEKNGVLFSGDTVFPDGAFGRVDFPTGDPDALIRSIRMLANLDVKHLLPGHMNAVLNQGKKHIELAAMYAENFL